MLRRSLLLSLLALLALPVAASAASTKITSGSVAVSPSGAASVRVANPTAQALRGTASVVAAGRTVASRPVRLPRRSTTSVSLRFGDAALTALRAAGGRATVKLALRRAGGRRVSVSRSVTLRLPAAPAPSMDAMPAPTPVPVTPPAPATPQPPAPQSEPTPAPAPVIPEHWVTRMGPDTVTMDVKDGVLQLTALAMFPVTCTETRGGTGATYSTRERFTVWGPWSIGSDAEATRSSVAINPLVGAAFRPFTFRVTSTSVTPERLSGTLHIAFTDRPWRGAGYADVECAGSHTFEAVPVP